MGKLEKNETSLVSLCVIHKNKQKEISLIKNNTIIIQRFIYISHLYLTSHISLIHCPHPPSSTIIMPVYTLEQLAWDYALCFLLLAVATQASRSLLKNADARWYFVHASANAFITLYSLSDVVHVFVDPNTAFIRPASASSINYKVAAMIGAVHAFHALFYTLTPADIFHHVAFVIFNQVAIFWPTLAGWEASHSMQWGSVINAINFFVCGLPGGIDYLCLCGVKDKLLSRERHKKIQAALNVWCRCPGIVVMVRCCEDFVLFFS